MAVAAAPSPSGFSYAQAAKGRTSNSASQTPSKVNSGTSTPAAVATPDASVTGIVAESSETAAATKADTTKSAMQDQVKPGPLKDLAIERTKSEGRGPEAASSRASLELASSSLTEKTEESSAVNGASDATSASTWETKSQASEGAWIAEREKRQQITNQGSEAPSKATVAKSGKGHNQEGKEVSPPQAAQPPPVLHDAPAPAVNPWVKRAEDAKAKALSKPAAAETVHEAQRPKTEAKKSQTAGDAVRDNNSDAKRLADNKRSNESRPSQRQGSRPGPEPSRNETHYGRVGQREHQSLPNLTSAAPPPPTRDEVSWPTPDSAQQEERKEVSGDKDSKDSNDSADADGSSGKPREKSKWTVFPVTPTIKWETEEMNRPARGSERPARGGSATRGRGGYRGAPIAFKSGDRGAARHQGANNDTEEASSADASAQPENAERDSLPPPTRPIRETSRSQSLDRRQPRNRPSPPKNAADRSAANAAAAGPQANGDARRTASPSKAEPTVADADAVKVADAAHRPNGATDESRDQHTNGDGPARRLPSSSRRESRNLEGYSNKDWANGSARGSKRGGRGRGGSREFTSGHQQAPAFANGNNEFANPSSFSIPPSPNAYSNTRGGFGFTAQNRGGWRGTPRSQSIPLDSAFGNNRFPPFAPSGPVPPPLQTHYYPAVFDPAFPLTAVPYAPMMEQQYLFDMISTQLDYYFSVDNLLKDTFLRRQMDSQGFVFFDVIVNFNRIKQLSQDRELIKAACLRSETIEIRVGDDGKERLRKRENWSQFVLPMDQREPTSQNDGPNSLQRPEAPQYPPVWSMNPGMHFRGPASAGPTGQQRRPFDAPGFPMNTMVAPFSPFGAPPQDSAAFNADPEELMRERATKSPARDQNEAAPSALTNAQPVEPDTFPDQKISDLSVIWKELPYARRAGYHATSSRTFSNGSIDSHNIASEIEKLSESREQAATNGVSSANGETNGTAAADNGSAQFPADKNTSEVIFLWLKDQAVHQDDIPKDAHMQPYFAARSEAFSQRERAPRGACPHDLDILYRFWSHFLIRNFNNRMYGEFKFYATDDAKHRDSVVGLTHLVNFYVNALKSNTHIIRDAVVVDYIALVKDQPANFQNYAFKQLRQAWRDGATNLKNRKKLTQFVDESLRAQLES